MPQNPRDDSERGAILDTLKLMLAGVQQRHSGASGGLTPIPKAEQDEPVRVASSKPSGVPRGTRVSFLGPTVPVGETACWVPPGTPVRFHDMLLPDGMIYVGQHLPSVNERTKEPALLNPSLRIGGAGYVYASPYDWPSYADWSPPTRKSYLEWLAEGRTAPNVMGAFVSLFFYGLERRLLASDPPPDADEKAKIRAEMQRLVTAYPIARLTSRVADLWAFLDFQASPNPEAFYLDLDRLRRLPQHYSNLPTLLEIALWHFAYRKEGVPAPYAYLWLTHDAEYSPRTAAQRCPDEMEQLFLHRYREQIPKGVRPTLRQTFITSLYHPMNHGMSGVPLKLNGVQPRNIGRGGLKALYDLSYQCTDALGAYSRYIGRHGDETRNTIAAVSLLPEPLRSQHPTLRDFGASVGAIMDTYSVPEIEKVPGVSRAALVPAPTLTALYNGNQGGPEALTRAPLLALLGALELAGVSVEPDARRGGLLWTAKDKVALVAGDVTGDAFNPEKDEADALYRAVLALFVAVSGGPDTPRVLLPDLVGRVVALADTHGVTPDTRGLAAVALHLAGSGAKLPRRAAFSVLSARERRWLADVLTGLLAARLRRTRLSATALAECSQYFTLIGCDPETAASRLHQAQTGDADDWTTVQIGTAPSGYALPPAPPGATAPVTGSGRRRGLAPLPPAAPPVVALDMTKVQAKIAESAEISALLHTIFTDEETGRSADPKTGRAEETDVKAEAAEPSPAASVNTAAVGGPTSGPLSAAQTAYLAALAGQDAWSLGDADALARTFGLLPLAAREAINDASFEVSGEALIEGDDPLTINSYALEEWKETHSLPL